MHMHPKINEKNDAWQSRLGDILVGFRSGLAGALRDATPLNKLYSIPPLLLSVTLCPFPSPFPSPSTTPSPSPSQLSRSPVLYTRSQGSTHTQPSYVGPGDSLPPTWCLKTMLPSVRPTTTERFRLLVRARVPRGGKKNKQKT